MESKINAIDSTKKVSPFLGKPEDEKSKEKTAYMGPSIGNLLNGSAQPPASAIQA